MSTSDIQKLREVTGAGVMDCKKAIDEAKGDFDLAVKIIHEKGILKVEKRSGQATGAGLVESYVHNERIGVLLELRAETDFVARSAPFRELSHEIVMQIAAMEPANVEELLAQPSVKNPSVTIGDLVNQTIAKVGENIRVGQFYRIAV